MEENMTNAHKYCFACGLQIDNRAEICPKCGVRQPVEKSSLSVVIGDKNRVVAALLAFFLGSFGAHKFYLGQIGLGFLYLVFCWTFIPGIIAFIEFIIYLTMSDEDFAKKYG